MESVVIHLPSQVQTDAFEVRMMVAGGLYERGKLSAGQAAEMVGITKRTFLEILGKYGFSVFGYSADELADDIKRMEAWRKL